MGRKKIVFFMVLVLTVIVIAGCSSLPGRHRSPSAIDPSKERFYKGTEGVIATFDSLPSRLYYYSGGSSDNEFEVGIDVSNQGASFTRGAVFLSGYDPNLLSFQEVPIAGGQIGACGFSLQSLGFGNWGGLFQCDGFAVGGTNTGSSFVDIRSMRNFVQKLGSTFGKSWWDSSKFDFSVTAQQGDGLTSFSMSMLDPNFDIEYMDHGRLLIALFSGLDFTRTYGIEYMLAGDTYEYPGGENAYITLHGRIMDQGWAPGLDQTKQSLMLTNCYFYTTYAAPLVCIDPFPQSGGPKVCTPGQHTWSGSQGAPVAITSVEQENTPQDIIFRINIKNMGHGEVFDPGKLEKCSPYYNDRVRPEDKNIVYLGDIRIGRTRLVDCIPQNGIVRLQNGRGTVTCRYPLEFTNLKSAYQTPLVIELWYGYSETQRRDLLIKRVS